ncbi:hypothetical protein ABW21_db0202497 [Orbilia brochopaga]|nr:hypothetical protein ABW21_db0202497 [Drechslerella brochopaga]
MPSTRQSYRNSIHANPPSPSSAPSASTAPQQLPQTKSAAAAQPSADHLSPRNPLHQQWEFAAVWEFLFQFHQGLKSAYYTDIEQFANDLSSPSGTQLLHDVQIGLLKNVSSQRGLTIDMFDDYTRRQYFAKRPDANPFGHDITPSSFYSLLPEERVRILHQLCMWILSKPEAFRDKVDPHKVADQTDWRMDPIGWDAKGTTFYQFDNGYLYCRTEPAPPVYQKWKSRKHAAGRSTKRRKVSDYDDDANGADNSPPVNENDAFVAQIEWKCVCSNLQEYRTFVAKLEKSKHPDEKELRKVIKEDILPVFEKEEQKRKRKHLEDEKEQARLQMLSGRKRSARVDERMARQREAQEREYVLRNEREELEQQHREELQKQKDEEARIAKLEERERRLQDRELRAKQRAEEKARLLDPDATESEDGASRGSRKSSRQLTKRKAELEVEDKDWIFDCVCGVYGVNYDDGTFSIACDKCSVWQHAACLGLPVSEAQEDEFICDRCRNKQNSKTSNTSFKIKLLFARPTSSEEEGDVGGPRNAIAHNGTNGINSSISAKSEDASSGNTSSFPATSPRLSTDSNTSSLTSSHPIHGPEPVNKLPQDPPRLDSASAVVASKPAPPSQLQTNPPTLFSQPSSSAPLQSGAHSNGIIQQSPATSDLL